MKTKPLFLIFYIFAVTGYGQVTPIKDKNWVLNPSLSDEFNGTSLDTAKWTTDVYAQYATSYPRNVTIEDMPKSSGIGNSNEIGVRPNRMLRLRAERSNAGTGRDGSTGGVQTKNANYLYGYYEMRARLPGYLDSNGKHCSGGFWPTLYVYHQVRDPNDWHHILEHEEIDIVEPNGWWHEEGMADDAQSNILGYGIIVNDSTKTNSDKLIKNLPPEYVDFHKYAAECLPDRVIYYFDDVPIHEVDETLFPTHLMRVVICNQLQNGSDKWLDQAANVFQYYNTPWPIYYDVDYFRYYQLNTQYCNNDALIINNTQLSNFVYGVRRNITIGNGSAAISLNAGQSVTFRATNDVTINGEFTVPLGSELNIIYTPCH